MLVLYAAHSYNGLKNLCLQPKCDQKRNQDFAKREGLEPKVNFLSTKIV